MSCCELNYSYKAVNIEYLLVTYKWFCIVWSVEFFSVLNNNSSLEGTLGGFLRNYSRGYDNANLLLKSQKDYLCSLSDRVPDRVSGREIFCNFSCD